MIFDPCFARSIMSAELFGGVRMIVYVATNIGNGHSYVGATVRPLYKRQAEHRQGAARLGKKRTCRAFHAALKKYGWEAFSWSVVVECGSAEELMVEEARIIRELKPHYIISSGGYGGNVRAIEGQAQLSLLQKPVRCVEDGKVYKSMSEAGIAYGVRMSLISGAICRGGRCRGRRFEFLDESRAVSPRRCAAKPPRGVLFRADKKTNPWQARVWANGSVRTLGFYGSPEEAHAAHLAEQGRRGVYDLPKRTNQSGYRNVCPHTGGGWAAAVKVGGKRQHLGIYPSAELARDAVLRAKSGALEQVRQEAISRPNRNASVPLKGIEKLSSGRWRAKYAKRHLGVFDTAEEAHQAYLVEKRGS